MFEILDERCRLDGRLTLNRLNDDGVRLLLKTLGQIDPCSDSEERLMREEAWAEFNMTAIKAVGPTIGAVV